MPTWAEAILIALTGSGGVTGLALLLKSVMKKLYWWRYSGGIQSVRATYNAMMEIMTATGAERVSLLRAVNGGGIPRPGSHMSSSVVAEVWSCDGGHQSDRWQKQPLDRFAIDMLVRLLADSRVSVDVDKMEESPLRTHLVANEVKQAENFLVGLRVDERALYYIRVDYPTTKTFTADENDTIRMCIAAIVQASKVITGQQLSDDRE